MQVFICWSGKASHKVAEALKTFLEDTIQEIKPFLSSESIQKGGRWLTEVSGQLSACNFGILCLTKENLDSRWLLFEAGALSKDSAEGRVSALLTGVEASAVESPLSQFQHTGTDRAEVLKLLQSINNLLPEPSRRTETQLTRAFDKSWPDLQRQLDEASKLKSPVPAPPARDTDSIMKEMLELLRGLARDAEAAKLTSTLSFPGYQMPAQISPALWDAIAKGGGTGLLGPTGPIVSGSSNVRSGILTVDEGADTAKSSGATFNVKPRTVSKAPVPFKPLKT